MAINTRLSGIHTTMLCVVLYYTDGLVIAVIMYCFEGQIKWLFEPKIDTKQ